ncbi:hypothetical protein H8S90_15185 [Olivibacter sp. SDN3]|uniref:TlpA family protein disulfide reductase n=1 Tax=Olivibacter sp. SDN3 TaxID=2764720 RepID=UPI001650E248|nr:hypothetical protein [Olivibacter sp. SDN3]QNL48146.1 hypothetical protein H8S90_15185 [Olivibacter sp. SDN3]
MKWNNSIKILLLILIPIHTIAGKSTDGGAEVKISFELDENTTYGRDGSMTVTVFKKYFHGAPELNHQIHTESFRDGKAVFLIELPEPSAYMKFECLIGNSLFSFNNINAVFLAEPGDEIHIILTEKGPKISGRGSEKYISRLRLIQTLYESDDDKFSELVNKRKYAELLRSLDDYFSTREIQLLNCLDKYQRYMHSSVYETMTYDCIGFLRGRKMEWIAQLLNNADITAQERDLLSDYVFKMQMTEMDTLTSYQQRAYFYLNYLVGLAFVGEELVQLANQRSFKSELAFNAVFERIVNTFDGELRDNMIMELFAQFGAKQDSSNDVLEKALAIVIDTECLRGLSAYKKKMQKGAPIYPFVLLDTAGNSYKPNDFKGKRVLMDFWYNGCLGCIGMAQSLQSVKDQFVGDTTLVFVTVNVDLKRERWIQGIRSGKYTSRGGIDLRVNGFGSKNPMLKYYGYNSYPRLLIMNEKGEILSSNPPNPRNKAGRERLIRLLKEN